MSFLTEAFQELRESEDFSLDKKGTKALKDFLDNDKEMEVVTVIDTDANTQDEVSNVHVGMTILGCEVCNSLHYVDDGDVVIDEEEGLANVGECCPYCFSTDGFKIVGTVAPYEDITVEVDNSNSKDVDVKVDGKEVPEEDIKEVNESIKVKRSIKNESIKLEAPYLDTRFDSRKSFYNKARINDTNDVLYSYETKVMEIKDGKPVLTIGEDLLSATTLRHIKEWLKQKGFPAESKQQILRDYAPKAVVESKGARRPLVKRPAIVEKKQKKTADDLTDVEIFDLVYAKLAEDGDSNTKDAKGNKMSARLNKGVGYSAQEIFPGENSSGVSCLVVKAQTKEGLQKAIEVAQYYDCLYEVKKLKNDKFAYGLFVDYGSGDLEKLLADEGKPFAGKKKGEKLTKDQVYPIRSPQPAQTGLRKNGKLDLSKTKAGDPNKSEILVEEDKENKSVRARARKIRDNEAKTLQSNNDNKNGLKEGMEDISITTDDTVIKVKATPRADKEAIVPPVEEEEVAKLDNEETPLDNDIPVEGEQDITTELDIEDIDEEGFDELGESYLKRVYENVSSFKTIGGKVGGNKLVLEGVIRFKSGKKAKTSFILESKEVTKRGKVRFVGMNENISKNKSAYTLTGRVDSNKKLIVEMFNYNYSGKDESTGKSKKLYGTVRRSK